MLVTKQLVQVLTKHTLMYICALLSVPCVYHKKVSEVKFLKAHYSKDFITLNKVKCSLNYLIYNLYYKSHLLEECLALKQRAEHAKSQFLSKRSKVRKVNYAFLPEGIQIEDLTQDSCHA